MERGRINSSSSSLTLKPVIDHKAHQISLISLSRMGPQKAFSVSLLIILSLLSLNFKVIYGDSSVDFLDNPINNYLRRPQAQDASLSPSELGAIASVLLGFAPPSTLTDSGSSKLNEVLMPNPFDRPRAILVLEVTGAEDKSPISGALRIKVVGNQRVDIQLPGEADVSLNSLNEVSRDTECSDEDLSGFASWLGGSYVEGASGPLNGELVIPLENGAFLRLHMSERADREFTTGLVTLINNIRGAAEMHHILTKREHRPAELTTGKFDGLKALKDHYGTGGVAQSAMEVFCTSISKIYDFLHAEYAGKIVGVIVHGDPQMSESENMLHVTIASQPSARFLEETEASPDLTKIAEVLFVRTILAWITGIILLIATLLGIYYLLYMPITKDTLLYSNVKLD